jgi:DNA-binding response OmpR family regulator
LETLARHERQDTGAAMNGDREDGDSMRREGDQPTMPRVLLVEDDTVSAAFLSEAIVALPAEAAIATTLAEALRCADAREFDLWLIDAHLPDGRGVELLAALRARGLDAPALAHTAETSVSMLDSLIDAGFEEVLIKPLSVAALQGAVRRFVDRAADRRRIDIPHAQAPSTASNATERSTCEKLPVWDDSAALRALNGSAAIVAQMRALFRVELPQQAQRIVAAHGDGNLVALRSELHKLLASAGFVGAARLRNAALDLQTEPESESARMRFEFALRDTLETAFDQRGS